jgi:hypothetical protein
MPTWRSRLYRRCLEPLCGPLSPHCLERHGVHGIRISLANNSAPQASSHADSTTVGYNFDKSKKLDGNDDADGGTGPTEYGDEEDVASKDDHRDGTLHATTGQLAEWKGAKKKQRVGQGTRATATRRRKLIDMDRRG